MCYYFWGAGCPAQDPDDLPAYLRDWQVFMPDWAWAEWVAEQGIGE